MVPPGPSGFPRAGLRPVAWAVFGWRPAVVVAGPGVRLLVACVRCSWRSLRADAPAAAAPAPGSLVLHVLASGG